MKFLQLRVQLRCIRRFRRFTGKLLVLLAGLHELLLQVLQIDIFKPPRLQQRDLLLQVLNLGGQSAGEFFAALPLLLRQIQFAAQINRILFQFPNFFPTILDKGLRGWKLYTGQSLLRLLIELCQHVALRNGR